MSRILLVDDDASLLKLMSMRLRSLSRAPSALSAVSTS